MTFTTPAAPANGAPGSFRFRPYSDFLVHDMGTLEDLIGNDFDSVATTRKMRTAPLWGLRLRKTTLLHDGSANNVSDAITRHDGQGLDSANRFRLLPPAQKRDLINYLMVHNRLSGTTDTALTASFVSDGDRPTNARGEPGVARRRSSW